MNDRKDSIKDPSTKQDTSKEEAIYDNVLFLTNFFRDDEVVVRECCSYQSCKANYGIQQSRKDTFGRLEVFDLFITLAHISGRCLVYHI